mmetsp:Transcript_10633/g.12139  ORF Transcript_10633/g.12139 Transcript_10633/m.12139 type:complete len:952 (+) Transcript_10633:261-3116(+)
MDNSSSASASASASSPPQERQGMFEGTEGDEPPPPRSEEEEEHQEKEKKYEQQQEGADDDVPYDEDTDIVEDDHEGVGRERFNDSSPSNTSIAMRCLLAGVLFYAALLQLSSSSSSSSFYTTIPSSANTDGGEEGTQQEEQPSPRRRLTAVMGDTIPSYMTALMKDLKERQQLFQDTPPEEIKYWFEYTGPLQKYFYRYSKSRGKADYFEGRDDSGVTSSRFTEDFLGSKEHNQMFSSSSSSSSHAIAKSGSNHHTMKYRLLENCLAMGSPVRPDTTTPLWKEWYGGSSKDEDNGARHVTYGYDRCRVLLTLNTVGAGRGTTMLWETAPPSLPHAQQPTNWQSEQETAATHLQRQFEEINAMCATNQIAARVQVLVCEPIAAKWTEWMDSLLPHCGGRVSNLDSIDMKTHQVEERASPIQVVVVATVESAETCHDLQSGFMERRTQDLIVAPPFVGDSGSVAGDTTANDPALKRTHPDLLSSADHDVYVGLKWTSLVTVRALHSFLQASADLAAGATSPINNKQNQETNEEDNANDLTVSTAPSSPFLIPSFVRVSYVSEENTKVAKWRMHGDFFHPAAWEICKDSFEVTWLDHSLSGPGGVTGLCYDPSTQATMKRRLAKSKGSSSTSNTHECGQWWIYNTELQMPNRPDVYANEITPPLVQGGNNFVWMLTERQRREIVKRQMCLHDIEQEEEEAEAEPDTQKKKKKNEEEKKASAAGRRKLFEQKKKACPAPPQAVMPLGDVESFLINYTPNTALGKKHVKDRRPGYSRAEERLAERELVKERKQLKGQEDIEKALFDYTIYPAALLRKDATLKAARGRDAVLVASAEAAAAKAKAKAKDNAKHEEEEKHTHSIGPTLIKSDYYDVTVTKPRQPVPGWCQAIARKGLCILYSDYFRTSNDVRCLEACGMKKNFSPIETDEDTDHDTDHDHHDTDGGASSSNKKKKEKK